MTETEWRNLLELAVRGVSLEAPFGRWIGRQVDAGRFRNVKLLRADESGAVISVAGGETHLFAMDGLFPISRAGHDPILDSVLLEVGFVGGDGSTLDGERMANATREFQAVHGPPAVVIDLSLLRYSGEDWIAPLLKSLRGLAPSRVCIVAAGQTATALLARDEVAKVDGLPERDSATAPIISLAQSVDGVLAFLGWVKRECRNWNEKRALNGTLDDEIGVLASRFAHGQAVRHLTTIGMRTSEDFIHELVRGLRKGLPGLDEEALFDFLEKNREQHPVGPYTLGGRLICVSDAEMDRILREPPKPSPGTARRFVTSFLAICRKAARLPEPQKLDRNEHESGWDRFPKLYPDSPAIAGFSRPGFNSNVTQALIYTEGQLHWTAGAGTYELLSKSSGTWKEVARFTAWRC